MGENIVLCGFMGSGKTTLGRRLARELDVSFTDIDDLIVQRAGMEISEIFQRFGEQGFRDREHEAVLALCGQGREGGVLATGGGALTFPRNVEPLRRSGMILYLDPGFEECWRRISQSDRPLVRANTKEQLAELYARRDELYRLAANVRLQMEGPPEKWVPAMQALVQEHLAGK